MIFAIDDSLCFLILNRRRSKIKDEVEFTSKLTSAISAGLGVASAVAGVRYIHTAFNSYYEHDLYG